MLTSAVLPEATLHLNQLSLCAKFSDGKFKFLVFALKKLLVLKRPLAAITQEQSQKPNMMPSFGLLFMILRSYFCA